MTKADPFAGQLSLPAEMLPTYAKPFVPSAPAVRRRREQFAQFPMWWRDVLDERPRANAAAWSLALYILHRFWKNNRKPFKLANMALRQDDVSRFSKWRALAALERRGLVMVERRAGKSPTIHPILDPKTVA